jgi:cobyrinic acid a,c-diamide synthase
VIAFMVAGTQSGAGKTTVALALMAALRQQGFTVQPFKCGPDFLDTGHHGALCGRASRNLDSWMLSREANRAVFSSASRGADAAIVEGAMGLYDGAVGETEEGSPAEMAKLLDLPVVLVIDAAKSARSIAAVVKGFESFDPAVRFAGIVLNRVGGEGHYRLLEAAIRRVSTTPLLGYLPKSAAIAIPERHLGLHTTEETTSAEDRLAAFAQAGREHLYLPPLLGLSWSGSWSGSGAEAPGRAARAAGAKQKRVRVGVARDKAFSFYYEDNFDLLREQGAEIVPFSPLEDAELPPNLDGLYLGGGYPELYAEELSRNAQMLAEVRAFAGQDKPVYAECGGMIYLGQSLTLLDGRRHSMAGVLPLEFEMTSRLVNFGYVQMVFAADCLLGKKGTAARGHSFHCSRVRGGDALAAAYRLTYVLSGREETEGFSRGNLLASYVHLHFRTNPALAVSLVGAARQSQSAEVPA